MDFHSSTPSSSLYNHDLAPVTSQNERTWGTFSLTSVWFAAMHNMGNYTMAAGFLFLGIGPIQLIFGCLIGFIITNIATLAMGYAGQRYGVPYPVLARVSFGVYGSNVPAMLRAIVAVCWYGIQTYLASRAIIVLLALVWPATATFDQSGSFLGLSYLGWICFLLLWAAQLFVVTHGLETVRKFQNYAGAAISILMIVIAVVLLAQTNWSLDFASAGSHGSIGHQINTMFSTGGLWVASFATLILNFCDFTRFGPSRKSVTMGGFWGLPINGILFMAVVIVATLASDQLYGRAMTDPTEMLAATGNNVVIVIGAIVFILATVGVNVIANLISPAYDLANLFPSKINFTRGAYIACVAALLVFPWKIYASTATLTYFLGALGAVLGPVFGIMLADYYGRRKQQVDVIALYSDDPSGPYYYTRGWNMKAIAALLPASAVCIAIVVIPALSFAGSYTWFVGVAISAATYLALTAKQEKSVEHYDTPTLAAEGVA